MLSLSVNSSVVSFLVWGGGGARPSKCTGRRKKITYNIDPSLSRKTILNQSVIQNADKINIISIEIYI